MNEIKLPKVGKLKLERPKMSIVYDIMSIWSANPSQAHIGRLAACAIGVCAVNAGLPVYDSDQARPIAFGGLIMDELLQRGVPPSDIVEKGVEILTVLAPLLLGDEEVKKK